MKRRSFLATFLAAPFAALLPSWTLPAGYVVNWKLAQRLTLAAMALKLRPPGFGILEVFDEFLFDLRDGEGKRIGYCAYLVKDDYAALVQFRTGSKLPPTELEVYAAFSEAVHNWASVRRANGEIKWLELDEMRVVSLMDELTFPSCSRVV